LHCCGIFAFFLLNLHCRGIFAFLPVKLHGQINHPLSREIT
jgi:hypothetical protein